MNNALSDEAIGEYLTSLELYRELAATFESREGNLLEKSDPATIAAQVRAMQWAVEQCRPRVVLETGTNKAMFGYVLSIILPHPNPLPMGEGVVLYTFDIDHRAGVAAAALADAVTGMRVWFTLGDTNETLKNFDEPIDLAWIDGGHDAKTAYNDITQAMRLGAQWILIDDAKQMASVMVAVLSAMADRPDYERVEHPWLPQDARGVAMLRLITE